MKHEVKKVRGVFEGGIRLGRVVDLLFRCRWQKTP
jgi:hypothetical protein